MPSMIIACRQETLYIEREPKGHPQDSATGWHRIPFSGEQERGCHCKVGKEKFIRVTGHGHTYRSRTFAEKYGHGFSGRALEEIK